MPLYPASQIVRHGGCPIQRIGYGFQTAQVVVVESRNSVSLHGLRKKTIIIVGVVHPTNARNRIQNCAAFFVKKGEACALIKMPPGCWGISL